VSARGLVLGALHKAADFRTSESGTRFATLSIREDVNGKIRWWRVTSFAQDVLYGLTEMAPGSPICVAGEIDAEIWSPPGGEARITWRLTCDGVLTAKAKCKTKVENVPRTPPRSGRAIAVKSWAAPPVVGGADASDLLL
jgi:Single-strand binding protein family